MSMILLQGFLMGFLALLVTEIRILCLSNDSYLLLELRAHVALCCMHQKSPGSSILRRLHPLVRVVHLQETQVGYHVVAPSLSWPAGRSTAVGGASQDLLHHLVISLPGDMPCSSKPLGPYVTADGRKPR